MERYRLDILDSTTADLKPHLEATVRWIDERLKRGVNVLVHCQQVCFFRFFVFLFVVLRLLHVSSFVF